MIYIPELEICVKDKDDGFVTAIDFYEEWGSFKDKNEALSKCKQIASEIIDCTNDYYRDLLNHTGGDYYCVVLEVLEDDECYYPILDVEDVEEIYL